MRRTSGTLTAENGRPMEKCEPPANQRHIIRLDLYLAHQKLGSQIWFATLVG